MYPRACARVRVEMSMKGVRAEGVSWKAMHARRQRDRNITITWNKRVGSLLLSPSVSFRYKKCSAHSVVADRRGYKRTFLALRCRYSAFVRRPRGPRQCHSNNETARSAAETPLTFDYVRSRRRRDTRREEIACRDGIARSMLATPGGRERSVIRVTARLAN